MSALPQLRPIQRANPLEVPAEVVFDVAEGWPLVPDAIYTAICCGCEVRPIYKSLKTYFRFRITEGEHAGKVLFRAYNVEGKIIPGKGPGTGPRPRITRGLDLFKMLCRVLSLPKDTKPYRVSSRELDGQLCRISTRTVTRDFQQKPLPEAARYSVVDDVLSIEAGSSLPIT